MPATDNQYLLALSAADGYIDGADLGEVEAAGALRNPFAVAQLVNHPPRGAQSNVFVETFLWADVLSALRDSGQLKEENEKVGALSECRDSKAHVALPNWTRCDGSPW